jgi:phospholipase C
MIDTKKHIKIGPKTLVLTCILILALLFVIILPKLFSKNDSSNQNTFIINHKIDHIVIIVDENKSFSALINNSQAPYINQIIHQGSYATNYTAVSKNPYIALTSGSLTHIPNSCNPKLDKCQTLVANITDEIEASGRTWDMYAESMPASCSFSNTKKYTVRHNPFLFYPSISGNSKQCKNQIVPFSDLWSDINARDLPNYVFISPNLCNDMHNCGINTGDKWLSKNVPRILSSYAFVKENSLLIITWDEGSKHDNRVLTIFLGPAAKQSYISHTPYNHYSILHTVEAVWKLKPMTTNDGNALVMSDMLKN